jgi:hypothetical protein
MNTMLASLSIQIVLIKTELLNQEGTKETCAEADRLLERHATLRVSTERDKEVKEFELEKEMAKFVNEHGTQIRPGY